MLSVGDTVQVDRGGLGDRAERLCASVMWVLVDRYRLAGVDA